MISTSPCFQIMDLPMHCCFNDEMGLLLKGDIDSDMPPNRFIGRYSPVWVIKSATSDKCRVLTDSIRIEYVLYLPDDGLSCGLYSVSIQHSMNTIGIYIITSSRSLDAVETSQDSGY
ncbi:hypothetical protein D5086_029051 [Populus alba]|uniref:Uncharacterized protein n=1 Tax=Populus alba TaxID=43335 RepID=A0ACC4AT03_POPAL